MSMNYIIIGNGVAGTEAAKAIRNRDPHAEIMIFTQDHYPFYSRLRLPELLAKEDTVEAIFYINVNGIIKIRFCCTSTVR